MAHYDHNWDKVLSLNEIDVNDMIGVVFSYSVIWIFGMAFYDRFSKESKKNVQQFLKQKISKIYSSFPMEADIFDYFVDLK